MGGIFAILNVNDGTYEEDFRVDNSTTPVGDGTEWSVRLQRLRGGLSDGVDVVWIDNGCTKLAILPTRGMGIWKAEVADLPIKWDSPVERPVHPSFVDEMRRGGIGWLDGFNELICRCGLSWHGAPGNDIQKNDCGEVTAEQFLPLHGRIANLSAHEVRVEVSDDGAISVIGVVDEASVFGGKLRLTSTLTTYIGSNTFEISDAVQNLGSARAEAEMLYHCNFGQPVLGDGATFHAAATEVAPRDEHAASDIDSWTSYSAPTPGYAEQVYFTRPVADDNGRGLAVLKSSSGEQAVAVRFDTTSLPWLVMWKNTQAAEDGYCTGIEPGSSLPNLRTFERQHDRVLNLDPMQTVTFSLSVSVATSAAQVDNLIGEVASLQASHKQVVHRNPVAEWSAS